MDELEAAGEAVNLRDRAVRIRHADLLATMCNLLGGGKKSWSTRDFLSEHDLTDAGERAPSAAEEAAGLARYQAEIERQAKAYREQKTERAEHAAADVEDASAD